MEFLTWPRFSSLQCLDLSESGVGLQPLASLARLLPRLPSLRQLSVSHTDLAPLPPELLALMTSHLVTLSLAQTRLNTQHLETLLQSIVIIRQLIPRTAKRGQRN